MFTRHLPGAPSALASGSFALLVALASGCGVTLRAGRLPVTPDDALEVEERAANRCVHGASGTEGAFREELPGPETDPELVAFLEPFEPGVRRTAVAAGIEPLLARVLRERERLRAGGGSSEALFSMRDELSARMFALETQLLAMEFEVDCVRALIHEVLGDYEEAETDRQLALTIASLVVGAGTGIASSLWDVGNSAVESPAWVEGPFWTAIVGAVATTALGVAVLVPTPGEIVYVHEHNVLWPLVVGEDDEHVYPTFIFRLLMMPMPGGAPSPRGELLEAFDELIADAAPDDARPLVREILFGAGGVHDARLLSLHEELLEEVGAALDALARDIDLLGSTIAYVLREDDRGGAAADAPRPEPGETAADPPRPEPGEPAADGPRPEPGEAAPDAP